MTNLSFKERLERLERVQGASLVPSGSSADVGLLPPKNLRDLQTIPAARCQSARKLLRDGKDPIEVRKAERSANQVTKAKSVTFDEALALDADMCIKQRFGTGICIQDEPDSVDRDGGLTNKIQRVCDA